MSSAIWTGVGYSYGAGKRPQNGRVRPCGGPGGKPVLLSFGPGGGKLSFFDQIRGFEAYFFIFNGFRRIFAGGDAATAGGDGITAGGDETTAGGGEMTAGGDETTAGGDETTAGGDGTTAGGDETTAGGDRMTAGGGGIPEDVSLGFRRGQTHFEFVGLLILLPDGQRQADGKVQSLRFKVLVGRASPRAAPCGGLPFLKLARGDTRPIGTGAGQSFGGTGFSFNVRKAQ